MPLFKKVPVTIEAVQWTGGNHDEITAFVGSQAVFHESGLSIKTLEGPHQASQNDWIIRGIKGEFYPCKPDIFDATYVAVED